MLIILEFKKKHGYSLKKEKANICQTCVDISHLSISIFCQFGRRKSGLHLIEGI